ncbi:hypothetical protein C8Q74DRAFT_316617 [Fomes fomentarius]|nr:hypothetical protein C8Q74DRAFT_316617 [Fomes fomentarius]
MLAHLDRLVDLGKLPVEVVLRLPFRTSGAKMSAACAGILDTLTGTMFYNRPGSSHASEKTESFRPEMSGSASLPRRPVLTDRRHSERLVFCSDRIDSACTSPEGCRTHIVHGHGKHQRTIIPPRAKPSMRPRYDSLADPGGRTIYSGVLRPCGAHNARVSMTTVRLGLKVGPVEGRIIKTPSVRWHVTPVPCQPPPHHTTRSIAQ